MARVTRREFWGYCFGAALLVFVVALLGMIFWAALPKPQIFDLGSIDSFGMDGPARRHVTLQDGSTVPLWVVRTDDTWRVFHGRAEVNTVWNCEYKWVPTNHRFEDPCSGFKWALTGELLTYFENPPTDGLPGLHDLDQYSVILRDNHLYVNIDKRSRSTVRTEPPPQVECETYSIWPDNVVSRCFLKMTPGEPLP